MSAPLAERTALKEWAVLVEAMGRGEIIALVRKGGIREQRAGFSVRHERFLLYPTYFHERESDLAPRFLSALRVAVRPPAGVIRFEYVADVAGVWRVTELEPLRGIDGEHGLAWCAVESRFHYRNAPGVQVVAVRVSRLPSPVEVPAERRYAGCVSWVELDTDVDVARSAPVLPADVFERRVDALRRVLATPEVR
jgi:hypothetical protein